MIPGIILLLSVAVFGVDGFCTNDCATEPTAQQFCYAMGTSVYPADAFNKCDPLGCQMVSINNQSDYDSFMAYRTCMGPDIWLPYKYNSATGKWIHFQTGQQIGYIAWSTGNPNAGSAAVYMETWNGALDDIAVPPAQSLVAANWMCICYMCGPFSDPNLVASMQWVPPLSNVTFSCTAGYTLNGVTDLTCQAGGKWNNSTAQTCVATTNTSITTPTTTSIPLTTPTTSATATTLTSAISTNPTTLSASTTLDYLPSTVSVNQSTTSFIATSAYSGTSIKIPRSVLWPLAVLVGLTFLIAAGCCLWALVILKTKVTERNSRKTDNKSSQ